jgi:S-adenosylmethionine:diacylglycerol 3-amino-3-carboxypropyl transferase
VTGAEALVRDYRAAFLRHLSRHEETSRAAGYDLGRAALAGGVGLLEVVRVHHAVLAEVLRAESADDVDAVASAASDFLLEVLASYHMVQRAFPRDGGADG